MKRQVTKQGIEKRNGCEHVLLKLFGFIRKKSSVSKAIRIIYYIEGFCAKSEEIT